jgi:hypothetical protein
MTSRWRKSIMTQPPGEPRTLDLYGGTGPRLHRARTAAIACWLIATWAALSLGSNLLMFLRQRSFLEHIASSTVYIAINVLFFAATIAVMIAGVLLAFAGIAGRAINSFPRWCAAILLAASAVLSFLLDLWLRGVFTSLMPSTMGFEDQLWRIYYPVNLLNGIIYFGALAFGLIYILQLAWWRRSFPLAFAGGIILGVACALFVAGCVLTALRLAEHYNPAIHLAPSTMAPIYAATRVLWNLEAVAILTFFVVLAVKLWKNRAAA